MIIIAVDDEQSALLLITDAIKEAVEDCELHTFNSPDSALEFAKTTAVDVAFLDIRMFKMTGLELAKCLKSTNPKMNIIFATGYDEFSIEAIYLHASGYITKPVTASKVREQMTNLLHPPEPPKCRFYAQTFGNFEFLVDGKPLAFPRKKSKELLAVLIDHDGTSLTTEQIAAILFEDRNYDRSIKNTLMPIIRCMQDTLTEVGAADIIVKTWGHLSVDTKKFGCDAYEYRAGNPDAINRFRGEYMANYSWAEERAAVFYWDMVEKSENKY